MLDPYILVMGFRRVSPFAGVESSLSMDEVPWKRYRGKLEHRVVDLVDHLPPPRHLDQLAVTTAAFTPPVVGGTSKSVGGNALAAFPVSTIVPLSGSYSYSTEVEEDSKDIIIFDVRHMQVKRKAVLTMGETVTSAPNVAKRV